MPSRAKRGIPPSPILVTGADGFIGRHLVGALAAAGEGAVHALVRRRPARPVRGVRYRVADVLDEKTLRRAIRSARPGVVFHLAGIVRRDDPRLVVVNALGTRALLRALAGAGARRLVLASTCEVYGDAPAPFREATSPAPRSPYAWSKLAAEEIARAAGRRLGVSVTVLRLSVVYGPGQKPGMFLPSLIAAARAGRPFPMTGGRQIRDFLHVADAVAAFRRAGARRAAGVFNVAAGRSVSLREAARLAERIAGRRFARPGAVPYRKGEIRDYRVDVSKARRLLGWRSRVTLEAGLRELIS